MLRTPPAVVAAVAVAAALAAPAGAKPHAGKVVRVERTLHSLTGVPRFCQLGADALHQVSGTCNGTMPTVGDVATVFVEQRVVAVVRIATVAPATDSQCVDTMAWIVTGTALSGPSTFANGIAFIDVPLDARIARIVIDDHPPISRVGGLEIQVWAIDGNGDGAPDLDLLNYSCDDNGSPIAGTGPNTCFDSWLVTTKGSERVRQDKLKTCW